MTRYYNMTDCFDACGDDDAPYIEGGFNSFGKMTKKEIKMSSEPFKLTWHEFLKDALSDKWQIQRAEPKVMTADEMMAEMVLLNHNRQDVIKYGEAMDLNGQLKEYQRHAELRKWAEATQEAHRRKYQCSDAELLIILKALTPPGGW